MSISKISTGTIAIALIVAVTVMPAFAAKTTPATDKNSAVPAVPRAIPDLIPYHKFDPPTSKMFDISKLTISGDIRVRPEFRNNIKFDAGRNASQNNSFFVQQWTRLGLHYAVSPEVVFFFQPQYSKNWGSGVNSVGGDPNASDGTIFARQAFMLIRNFATPNLTVKVGRQMMVWGNHRMFGHFDWNNVGWSFDGITANYKLNPSTSLQFGWLRVDETNCGTGVTTGGCSTTSNDNNASSTEGNADADIIYVRAPMKMLGMTLEPTYIWHNGGTHRRATAGTAASPTTLALPRPGNQTRHTVGGRAVRKMSVGDSRVDATFEGYYQFGEIGVNETVGRDMDISAFALHFDGGITLPVPMQPRLGGEFNIASGDDQANCSSRAAAAVDCGTKWTGFDQLYPTNHIHFGYMDRMSWKNMVHWSLGLQLRPTPDSHFEVSGHFFALKEEQDNWYGAAQTTFMASDSLNTEDDLGKEVDVVYTMFFTPGNHVGWQIGGGIFFPGEFVNGRDGRSEDPSAETWGYTQLWINF